eukprot:scaffold2179_cov165-Amphora_coffeaeformis.AAC.20
MAMTPIRKRMSTGTAASSLTMMASCSDDDAMEEASVFTLSSPPRSASKSSTATALFQEQTTPKSSRRLFEGGDDDDDEGFFHPPRAPALTPYNAKPRARVARPRQSHEESLESEDLTGRKRSSEERRDSTDGDASMHMSPHISPNSYITMDGRFVHSKNPFSSPMITEDESHHIQFMGGAPSIPVNFAMGGSTGPAASATPASPPRPPTLGLLPPRHAREKRGTYRDRGSGGSATDGFMDARFSFTGSPIPEHSHPPTHEADSGSATAGSLQKVRRLTENDDIVSASSHLFYSRRRQYLSIETNPSDLSTASFSDSSAGTWKIDEDDDRISPTDILSFPSPPIPTKKSSMTNYPRYKGRQAPPTPVAQRRHERLVQRRTPHPGSILRRHLPDDDDEAPTLKSRFYDDFDIIQELGKGSFGTVYQVLSRLDGCMYAIKAAQRQAKGASDRDRMLKEVYALASLSDQADTATFHIVRYHQAWMEDDRLFIQTELCQGNLAKEIAQNRLNLPRRYKLLREMCLALDFLHRHEMVHLDIKPENIFIKNDQFKLGDFGLASKSSSHEDVEEGDSRYMSLELLSGDHSDLTKSDIFSLGATLYEICRGQPLPLSGQEWQDMRHGRLQHIHQDGITVDADMVTFVHHMMSADPQQRPAASSLLQHPQLLSDDQKALRAERFKVEQANLALQRLSPKPPPTRPRPFGRPMQRSNTWSGNSCYF